MINDPTTNKNPNIIWGIILVILLLVTIFIGYQYFKVNTDLQRTQNIIKQQAVNAEVLDFTVFFIESVLKAEEDVDFETRLKLESAVRNLNDEEIFESWNGFVNAADDNIAQKEVKNLLSILVSKIK